jgi:uncharacterized protein (TIGR03086 family)
MSQVLRDYTKALYGFDAVVQRVPADGWDADSPCEGWKVRDVVAHAAGVVDAVAQMARTGEVAMPQTPDSGGDVLALWNGSRDGLLEALDHPGVLGRSGTYWFGDATIEDILAFAQWDPLVHSWDVATAVGAEPHADERVAEASLQVIGSMADGLRGMKLMGEPVAAPSDASAMTRLVALTGRDPAR